MKLYPAIVLLLCASVMTSCDNSTRDDYRNLAWRHAAYHSSSSDYNLTAQLATDGIIATTRPATLTVTTHQGEVPVNDREKLLDDNDVSKLEFQGSDIFVQLDYENMAPDADMIVLRGRVHVDPTEVKGYEIVTTASIDGREWEEIDRQKGTGVIGQAMPAGNWGAPRGNAVNNDNPSPVVFLYDYQAPQKEEAQSDNRYRMPRGDVRMIDYRVPVDAEKKYQHYKISLNAPAAKYWELSSWEFSRDGEPFYAIPSTQFTSAWRSRTGGEEWLYVDLGAPAIFDKIVLNWLNKAAKGEIQVSDDAENWRSIAQLPETQELVDEITLDKAAKAQYVRLALAESANAQPYELSEIQVWGTGGADFSENAIAKSAPDNVGYGRWRLERASEVAASPELISTVGYDDSQWVPATVPGSVLTSYINIGAVPDPNYADNQLQISESYFLSDFWYRTEFDQEEADGISLLQFDGVNWKAQAYLNGEHIGDIDGAFKRGNFNITDKLKPGKNALAVKIIRPAHPGAVKEQTAYTADGNGGALGADNPTFHASIGWDWIPTIRGRNIGLWNDVRIARNGGVTIEDPFVQTRLNLPDTTMAYVSVEATLKNNTDQPIAGVFAGSIADAQFSKKVEIPANGEILVSFTPDDVEALAIKNPRLWWPKGYGQQNLYDVAMKFDVDGATSHEKSFKTGLRQMDFDESEYLPSGGVFTSSFGEAIPKRLSLYVNGRRFVGFGGNWGFSESNLAYRDRDYDIAVGYHADQNFTMIRNWVGQIGDEEFYEACDRHGVMVWQDFWLANPYDGPDPYYNEMFEENAQDFVRRIRNHPSIALYCGRNEGNPPQVLDDYLRQMVAQEHPGIHYISHSAAGVVSGGGPYRALPPRDYFNLHGHDKMHSERGMPCVMNYEHIVKAMGAEAAEKLNTVDNPSDMYGLHDYTLNSAQSASSFNDLMQQAFDTPRDAQEFAEWAQWINYNGYRAIFESRSEHRRGMLLWMSHPAWPSMVWQTYDYYFEPTAAYFGCKKACEPLHIQWNPLRDDIEVVNYHAGNQTGLTAEAQIFDQNGVSRWQQACELDIADDQTVACFPIVVPEDISDTYFIKLSLTDADGNVLSDNTYWRGKEENNFKSLLDVPQAKVSAKWDQTKEGGKTILNGKLRNESNVPAMMIRLKAVDRQGEMILPVIYSDNYFFLMPGEERNIDIIIDDADLGKGNPKVEISYMNQ